jgi:hypothetical protein
MSEVLDLHTIIAETYSELIECEYDPLAIAASLMVTALSIYASQLTPEAYTEVVEKIFSTSDMFITSKNRNLH